MFRRILNWLKESFGGATTPEEVCTLRMMQMKWEGPVAMVPGEANAAKFSDVLDDHWKTLVLARALRKKLDEPLVELTATETKVEQWMRLHRLFCLSGDTPIVDAHKYMAARMVMDSVMTQEERVTVQNLAFGSSPKPPN